MKVCIPFIGGPCDSVELRYALRSHALYEPSWEPVLVVNQKEMVPGWYSGESLCNDSSKPQNVYLDQFRKNNFFASFYPGIPYVYTSDDTFLLGPWQNVNRYAAKSPVYMGIHADAMTNTGEALARAGKLLQFDFFLHCPQHRHTDQWMDLWIRTNGSGNHTPVNHRSLYGNLFLAQDLHATWDRKVINWHKRPVDSWKFFSTQDNMAGDPLFHRWLKERFPKRSPWEKVG